MFYFKKKKILICVEIYKTPLNHHSSLPFSYAVKFYALKRIISVLLRFSVVLYEQLVKGSLKKNYSAFLYSFKKFNKKIISYFIKVQLFLPLQQPSIDSASIISTENFEK
jgi:hypothetical protein